MLVISDQFTRWTDAVALPDATASTVAKALESRVFSYLGGPEQISSDQGAQFKGRLMQELSDLGVEKTRTMPYHPQSNGVVKRNNRTFVDSIRSLLLGSGEEWVKVLPHVMSVFRATPHSSTKETMNQLMLGYEIWLPDQLSCAAPPPENVPVEVYSKELLENKESSSLA